MSSDKLAVVLPKQVILSALKCSGHENIVVTKVKVRIATSEIEGYTSVVLRATVDFTEDDNLKTKTFFVKTESEQPDVSKEYDFFAREAQFFESVVPEFLGCHVFSIDDLPLPKCFYTVTGDKDIKDVIVLEDLCETGYQTVGARFTGDLGVEYCKQVMIELGKLHALSVIVEERRGKKINQLFPLVVKEGLFPREKPAFRSMFNEGMNVIVELCKVMPEYRNSVDVLRKKLLDEMWNKMCDFVKPSDELNVLCHGDCWTNNLMFKCDQIGDQVLPVSVKLIDFQMCRYASPCIDLLDFLYSSTRRKVRDDNLDSLLTTYMNSFNNCLASSGATSPFLDLSYVKQTYTSMKQYGTMIAAAWKPIILMQQDFSESVFSEGDKPPIVRQKFLSDSEYRKKVTEIITEVFEVLDI